MYEPILYDYGEKVVENGSHIVLMGGECMGYAQLCYGYSFLITPLQAEKQELGVKDGQGNRNRATGQRQIGHWMMLPVTNSYIALSILSRMESTLFPTLSPSPTFSLSCHLFI